MHGSRPLNPNPQTFLQLIKTSGVKIGPTLKNDLFYEQEEIKS